MGILAEHVLVLFHRPRQGRVAGGVAQYAAAAAGRLVHLLADLSLFAHGAKAADEQRRTDPLREVDEQPVERLHLEAWLVAIRRARF